MKLLTFFICILLTSCSAVAEQQKHSGVPASINNIKVHRVDDHLIRIIKHNMEIEPKVELEFILPPEMKIIDYLSITSAKTTDREYIFTNSDGVYVEGIDVTKEAIEIAFEYYLPKSEAVRLSCKIPISNEGFGSIACEKD